MIFSVSNQHILFHKKIVREVLALLFDKMLIFGGVQGFLNLFLFEYHHKRFFLLERGFHRIGVQFQGIQKELLKVFLFQDILIVETLCHFL